MSLNELVLDKNKVESGEFWSSKQRQGHKLHHIVSYRASFKPELPSFFMNTYLNKKARTIFDPFGGRGTTAIQANLEGHFAIHNDINPLSLFLAKSRKVIPANELIEKRLRQLNLTRNVASSEEDEDLLPFFHPLTLREIKNLRLYRQNDDSPEMNLISLIALSRLHGHSAGFFSVYSFPQISVPPSSQRKINKDRNQKPEYRPVVPRILKKMYADLSDQLPPFYHEFSSKNLYFNESSQNLKSVPVAIADLAITSPPFLDKVNYEQDNWLKNWFLGMPISRNKKPTVVQKLDEWKLFIHNTLLETSRILKSGGRLIMEVGEVVSQKNTIDLASEVIQSSTGTTLRWEKTFIQQQKFTKLSNCWNISNNEKGTNTNRCVVFINNP